MSELSVSDSSTRHLNIMKEFAKDYSTTIPPIAIDDLRDDYKDAIQCISLEKVVQKLENRIVDMSFELANAKANEDSLRLKESMRRRTTSDASPMFASWRGVNDVENTFARAGSTETECSGSTTPSTPTPSPPTPKKILRRATLSIGGGGSTNTMKFGRRNSMPNAFKPDNKEKMKLKRVSWPGVDEDEDDEEDDQCPLPNTQSQQQQPQPFKLFRRASTAPATQVEEAPPSRQISRSLSGRRIVVDQQDDASDITFLQQPPPPPSRSINRDDESSQRSFDLGQLFKRDNSRRRSSTESEEPIVEEERHETSPNTNRFLGLGQLFQGRSKNRLSNDKKEDEQDVAFDTKEIQKRIAHHKLRASLLDANGDDWAPVYARGA